MTEALGSMNKYNLCVVCCGKVKTMKIFHKHLSTAQYNSLMAKKGETSPMCYFCDILTQLNTCQEVRSSCPPPP